MQDLLGTKCYFNHASEISCDVEQTPSLLNANNLSITTITPTFAFTLEYRRSRRAHSLGKLNLLWLKVGHLTAVLHSSKITSRPLHCLTHPKGRVLSSHNPEAAISL